MGWIWFKGIKTRKPAKTASLMLDTAAAEQSFLGRGPLKGGCGERPVSISFRVTLRGTAGARAGSSAPSPASWVIWDSSPCLGLQRGTAWLTAPAGPASGLWGRPTLMHTYLCLVSWPPGAGTKSAPDPQPWGCQKLLPDPPQGSERGRRRA